MMDAKIPQPRGPGCFASAHLQYRPLCVADAETLVRWRSDPDTIRYYRDPTPLTLEKHLHWYYDLYLPDASRYDWMVRCGEQAVGVVTLADMDFAAHTCEIGYVVGERACRRRGFGAEMIQAVVEHGAKQFGMQTFLAIVHCQNTASQRAALRNGFAQEGMDGLFYCYVKKLTGGGRLLTSLYSDAAWYQVQAA